MYVFNANRLAAPTPQRRSIKAQGFPISIQHHYLESEGTREGIRSDFQFPVGPSHSVTEESRKETLERNESGWSSNDPNSMMIHIKAIEAKGSNKPPMTDSLEISNTSSESATDKLRGESKYLMSSASALDRVSEHDELEEESKSIIDMNEQPAHQTTKKRKIRHYKNQ
jgi:hypothetical protein